MKKIKLNLASMNATEILSRDQLKTIFGGGSFDDGYSSKECKTTSKTEACSNKQSGDSCCFITDNGGPSYGKCVSIYAQALHCSDLN